MIYKSICISIICLLSCACALRSQDSLSTTRQVSLDNTGQFSIRSKYVEGENYVIRVSLPVNYNSYDYSFPVLYVLDGDKSFGMTKDIADWLMWFGEIRDIIVVGISYGQGTDAWWEKRERDYTHCKDTVNARGSAGNSGGADNFLRFIREELMPVVNKKYRTRQDSNALMGISYGGMLCSYVLFSRPEMFNGYIIIGPTLIWNNNSILKLEVEYSKIHRELKKKVYISYGSLDNRSWVINPTEQFINEISKHNYEGLRMATQVLEGETHISAYATAVTHGLKILFKR
jgi:predicted alpha/beta superfamily hydrolase